jgi:SAM-dependent methyltransferase
MAMTEMTTPATVTNWSGRYDKGVVHRMLFEPSLRLLLSRLSLHRTARVLDVGCGAGGLLACVADEYPGVELVGIDLKRPGLVQGVHKLGKCARFIQADAERLPLPNKHFDALLNAHSFHHFYNQTAAAAEMFRVVKPGGEVLIVDGGCDGPWGRMLYDHIAPAFQGEITHASRARLRALLEDAGFDVLRQECGGWLLPYVLTHCRSPQLGSSVVPAPHFRLYGQSRDETRPFQLTVEDQPTKITRRAA